MTYANNEALILRYFEEVQNQGKLEVLDEIIAPEYINHSPGIANPLPGPIGLKPIVKAIRCAFPDLRFVIENMVVSDSQVAVHTTMHWSHLGHFFGMPPTQKVMNVNQIQIERIHNNKITEHWRVTDDMTLMRHPVAVQAAPAKLKTGIITMKMMPRRNAKSLKQNTKNPPEGQRPNYM